MIEGTLVQVSKLPPAKDNPYPDCYYTATAELKTIISGSIVPQRMILVLPGFFSRQYASEANFKVGDKVRATVVPFASMPDSVRQIQQADETEELDLQFFYPEQISLIKGFEKVNSLPFAERSPRSDSVQFQPIDLKARQARQETMRRDLEEINKLLAQHGGDWDKWYGSLKDFREQYKGQFEAKAQRWIGDSFFSAGQIPHGKVYSPEFVKSAIEFKRYLAQYNIDLILVRYPFKGEIVDDLFAPLPADQISNPYLLRMYKELLEADIEIITDIIPRGKAARLKYPLMYWYQDFDEPHPAEGMAWVVAKALSERLTRYEKIRNITKVDFEIRKKSTASDSRNLRWPKNNPKFNPNDYVEFSSVSTKNGKLLQTVEGANSPLLMVGSSFIENPSWRLGGSVPAYTAYLTGVVPDTLFRRGSDAAIPRSIAREGYAFLKNRIVCLFPVSPWFFYDALSTPPITDPAKARKTLLASFTAHNLQKHILIASETPKDVFRYANDGSLRFQQSVQRPNSAHNVKIVMPKEINSFPFFMIEIESLTGDIVKIKATYQDQSDMIQKSYSQKNVNDYIVFKSSNSNIVEINFSNMTSGGRTVINSITVYGLEP